MFKKLLMVTAILATSSTIAMANLSAPYLGGSLGVNNNSASNSGFYRGVPLTVFGGYGQTLNQSSIYLGGEVFATLATLTLNNDSFGIAGLRSTYGYGASFLPGYLLADRTLAFIRLGIIRSRFSHIQSTGTGAQLGLGLQTNVIQNWDLRAEYDYSKFGSISGVSPRTDLFNLGLVYRID